MKNAAPVIAAEKAVGTSTDPGSITVEASHSPGPEAPRTAGHLFSLIYDELRKLAAARLACEPAGQTLQPTALVHEVWLRLGRDRRNMWQNEAHFFAAAAEAMRRILIDRARHRHALRHGGGQQRVDIDEIELAAFAGDDSQLLEVDEALARLAVVDPPSAELVKLHYFAGLTMAEAARALGISLPTAWRWWSYARAWLFDDISERHRG